MRIHLVFPQFPPQLDGIGDYTAHLAVALVRQGMEVKVLTAQKAVTELPDVEVEPVFSISPPSGVSGLSAAFRDDLPDWIIVQYNPFSYGHWGFNPWLPEALAQLKQEHPRLRVAIMIHEPFVPLTSWQFALMTTWQRWQIYRLGHVADLVLCAIEPWTRTLRSYVSSGVPLVALPVGSNIPDAGYGRAEARGALGIEDDEFVVGIFGSARRLHELIRAAADRLAARISSICVLYVGPDGTKLQTALAGHPLLDLGPRPASEVSLALRAMDIHLAPYPRGVSARRGAFIAGLQHGVPTVSTRGDHTDAFIACMDGVAFSLTPEKEPRAYANATLALAEDAEHRQRMAASARAFHDQYFAWDQLAKRLMRGLTMTSLPELRSGSSSVHMSLKSERTQR